MKSEQSEQMCSPMYMVLSETSELQTQKTDSLNNVTTRCYRITVIT